MFTVTFYSFKGGVGRTLSMMNTAYRLSQAGKRVFLLDFDLEAPGIDVFSSASENQAPGLLDYISHYTEGGSVPALEKYVSEISWGTQAPVFYMSAGRRGQNYQSLLARLNWKDFYARHRGFYFVENLKAAISAVYNPDYVFVDSRTGLTDISGICTLQLPDLVVLLFGLNDQNLIGTSQIYRSITCNTLNRSIQTLLVASPVPDVPEFIGIKKQRLQRAKELLGSEPHVVLPFNAFVAFKETIVPSEMGEFLNQAYDVLCRKIVSCNRADVWNLLRDARSAKEAGNLEQAEALYEQIVQANPRNPDAWTDFGSFLRSSSKTIEALRAYLEAERVGAKPSIYGDIAVTFLYLKQFDSARQYLSKYLASDVNPSSAFEIARAFAYQDQAQPAIEIYEKIAIASEAGREIIDGALLEIGNLYLRLREPGKAVPYYEKILARSPVSLPSAYNLGMALFRLGRISEAVSFFRKATAMFERMGATQGLAVGRANTLQAISQAYAAIGSTPQAIKLLKEAIAIAEGLQLYVFSSIQYKNITTEEFVEESRKLLSTYLSHSQHAADESFTA